MRNPTRRTWANKPGFYFCIRVGGWKIDNTGIRRFIKVEAWSRKTGAKTSRYNWEHFWKSRKNYLVNEWFA